MDYSTYDVNTIGRVFMYCAPANCDPVYGRTSGSNDTRFTLNEKILRIISFYIIEHLFSTPRRNAPCAKSDINISSKISLVHNITLLSFLSKREILFCIFNSPFYSRIFIFIYVCCSIDLSSCFEE